MKAIGISNNGFVEQTIVCIIKPCKGDTDQTDIYITTNGQALTWVWIWRKGSIGVINSDGRIFAHRLLQKAIMLADDACSEAIRAAIAANIERVKSDYIKIPALERLQGFKLNFQI